ncbi:hypothetical protein BBO99_00002070 [Phytophthora kernoviae]|uniref:Condensin complex subunit 1 C-terminal domain-containing protein n=2 Tax=Phytophthora kernoviae TaxID=325452 RepID=A0A3R7JG55_9STRA|nr:hypothetical protein G195_003512 [Phytophthora kernoviae 00238/432]KAG2530397.1 hypothetical protein JM16_001601 [Phytophthora kernoviae]KAG2532532.1 hypothetical protein JM18_000434 [Phytophthora kernoviae]RLN45515.1 hypothetical protein BBI17_001925 [Phytophthora kernoviae]RLN83506.1 hypothetical protein BBO99_00002070 [Phytophthora kernoviae]
MHRVSDQLRDRHPYMDQEFQESYNPKEVTRAYGARAIPKYAELLAMEDLSDEDRCKALQDLRGLLSSPDAKYTAVMKELMFICSDLTHSISAEVRTNSALVVASLVLFEMDSPNDLSDEVVLNAATRLLDDDDEEVVAAGCRIFINLTFSNEGLKVITNVAANDQAKHEAIQLDAVEICLKVLSKVLLGQVRCEPPSKRDELTRCVVSAVMALSTSEDAKPRVIEFGIDPLAQCLTHTSASVRQNASIAINSACDLPRGVAPFTQRLLHAPDLLVDVLGVKAVPALNKSVSSFDDDDTPAALKALSALQLKDAPGTASRIVQTLDMVANLIKLLIDGEVPAETQHEVADVLRRMSETDPNYQKRVGKMMLKHGISEPQFTLITGLTIGEFEQLA